MVMNRKIWYNISSDKLYSGGSMTRDEAVKAVDYIVKTNELEGTVYTEAEKADFMAAAEGRISVEELIEKIIND